MKDPGLYAEVRGRVKYKGVGSYIGDYKTGKMVVAPEGVHWKCQLWINTKRESPVVNLQVSQPLIISMVSVTSDLKCLMSTDRNEQF